MDLPDKPRWLGDHEQLLNLLHGFLDKLDLKPAEQRSQPPAVSLNPDTLPALFHQGEAADQLWNLLNALAREFHLLEIRLDRKRNPYEPEYSNARLRFNMSQENLLRQWLQRPRTRSKLQQWQQLVDAQAHQFPGNVQRLRNRIPSGTGLQLPALLNGFLNIVRYQDQALSLRQISARCFAGLSKFLDNKPDLVSSLYPDLQCLERAILVNVFLPEQFQQVLFVENWDNYSRLVLEHADCQMAVVYSSGFKSSAARIRQRQGVSLHYHGQSVFSQISLFEDWWFQQTKDGQEPRIYFWGDLDYAGMAILKALKERFTQLQAWQDGYSQLLRMLEEGQGHAPDQGQKEQQLDPGSTNCPYADAKLLPALRHYGCFVDQEMI